MWFNIYQDKKGKWRWQAIANNHKIVADSGQGYSRLWNCKQSLNDFKRQAPYASVEVIRP